MAAISIIRPLTGLDRMPLDRQQQIVGYLGGSDRVECTRVSRRYKVIIEKLNKDESQQIRDYVKSLLETLKEPESTKIYNDLYHLSKLVNRTRLALSEKQRNFHIFLTAYFKLVFYKGSYDCPTRKLLMTNHQFAPEAVRWNSDAMAFVPTDHPHYETIAQNFLKTSSPDFSLIKRTNHPSYPTLALEAVRRYTHAMKEVPTNHPHYTDTLNYATIALAAVKYYGQAIQYIPTSHPSYTDTLNYATIALAAVKQNAGAILYISGHPSYADTFNYMTLALEAIKQCPHLISSIEKSHPDYSTIAIEALKNYKAALTYIPKDHPSYIAILLGAVRQQPELLSNIPKEFIKIDFALEFIKCHPRYLDRFRHLEKDKDYPTLLLEAIKRCGLNIQSVLENHSHYTETINYATLALEAVKQNGRAIQFIRKEHLSYTTTLNYRTLALEAIRQTPQAFECIRKDVVSNCADFVLEMIQRWPNYNIKTLIDYVGDMSVIMEAARSI